MEDKKIIHFDSPEAATYRTNIEGWVGADGRFFGKDERLARYAGCTHRKCESCDNYTEKTWIYCEDCRAKRSRERYQALPYVEWDGKAPICTSDGDKYFFSEEELINYLEDNELNGSDLMLVAAAPIYYRPISMDHFGADAHEDWEPEKELIEAMEKFNEVVQKIPPHSYTIGKIRTSYDYTYKPEE